MVAMALLFTQTLVTLFHLSLIKLLRFKAMSLYLSFLSVYYLWQKQFLRTDVYRKLIGP